MKRINNYYEIKKKDYNWAPIKLIDIQDNSSTIQILKNNLEIEVINGSFREISISKIHLERIGFDNERLNDIFVVPIYMILGEDLMNLTSAYFGYIVFHKDEILEVQKKYNSALSEVYKIHKINPEIIFDRDNRIKEKLNSILYINQLFERLEEYDINVENKVEILIG